jgi:2-iminobutanoate/2-iminopropanoate deaminase
MGRNVIDLPNTTRGGYAAAVRASRTGLVEISGLSAYDESGHELFPGDLLQQTRYVLTELMLPILHEAGAGFDSICRLSVFTTDMRQWPEVWNEVKSMIEPPPAMTVVEITRLVGMDGMVELEITAATDEEQAKHTQPRRVKAMSSAQTHQGAVPVLPPSLAGRDWKFHAAAFKLGEGDLMFLSGMGPTDGDGNTIGVGDAGAQTRQIISNIDKILREAGGTLDDVVRVRVFATDMRHRPKINAERTKAFKEPRAVSTFVQVGGLESEDWLVAIEATAFIPKHDA